MPALQKWEWFIFGDRSSRLTCVLKKSDRLPASANETFPLDLFAENSLRSQIHQNSKTKTFAKNHKSPYFCLVSANVTFQQKQFSGYNKIEIKQWKGVFSVLESPFHSGPKFSREINLSEHFSSDKNVSPILISSFLPIWELETSIESFADLGSKRFQILLMLVIFISNWTRSIICVSKKKTTTFLVFLQRARTTKCKMQGRQVLFWNWNVGNTQKSCFSFKRGKRGRWRMHLFPLFTRQYSAAEID